MKIISFIGGMGFFLSFLAHVLSLCRVDVQAYFPPVFVLHVLIFPVWIAMILTAQRTISKDKSGQFWTRIMEHAPQWMKIVCVLLVPYVSIHFLYMITIPNGGAEAIRENDRMILVDRGKTVREITEAEFNFYKCFDVRLASGHWMVFYMIGWTGVVSYRRQKKINPDQSPKACDSEYAWAQNSDSGNEGPKNTFR